MNFLYVRGAFEGILSIYIMYLLIAGSGNTKPPIITTTKPTGNFLALEDK